MNYLRYIVYLLFGIFLFVAVWEKGLEDKMVVKSVVQKIDKVPVQQEKNELKVGAGAVKATPILFDEPVELDEKSRDEILARRTMRVNYYAMLLDKGYKPSMSVFGQIVDHKPWWGIEGEFCMGPGRRSIDGPAEESRFLMNPFLLLGLDEGKAFTIRGVYCIPAFPRPLSLIWSPMEAKAEVVYDITRFYQERARYPKVNGEYDVLQLIDYNARDFGYQYIHVDSIQSHHVEPQADAGMFTDVVPMKGFIHLGGSCGYPGGCNNASPHQPDLIFRIKSVPALLNCKLWKERPAGPDQRADFTFIIRLD